MTGSEVGIYVHIPFCERKCAYCAFYSKRCDEQTQKAYAEAVCRNIRAYRERALSCDTVYFGGGTPSVAAHEHIESILSAVRESFTLSDSAEITIEANPDSASIEKLTAYRNMGINRISFGVQSLDDKELTALGRLHDSGKAVSAVQNAMSAGFDNISCDIMIGTPEQTASSLLKTADRLSALPISHLSAYLLSVEKGTPFYESGVSVNDEEQAQMYLSLVKRLADRGFEQYEVSNFARDGKVSRHNVRYWRGREYIGFGASAHSFFEGVRFCCDTDIEGYIHSPVQPGTVLESCPDRLEEYIMLGLRLSEGIRYSELASLGADEKKLERIKKLARELEKHGLCRACDERICLTAEGFLISNEIIAQFELC